MWGTVKEKNKNASERKKKIGRLTRTAKYHAHEGGGVARGKRHSNEMGVKNKNRDSPDAKKAQKKMDWVVTLTLGPGGG